jgi:hypothetical protein
MSGSRRSKLDRQAMTAALKIVDDEVGKIVAEIASHRDDLPHDSAPKPVKAA